MNADPKMHPLSGDSLTVYISCDWGVHARPSLRYNRKTAGQSVAYCFLNLEGEAATPHSYSIKGARRVYTGSRALCELARSALTDRPRTDHPVLRLLPLSGDVNPKIHRRVMKVIPKVSLL